MSRIALISGSTGGLGSALARKMAKAGYRLALHYFQHVEEAKASPDASKLALYKEISEILMREHRAFYKFTDEEIEHKVSVLSPIIKDMVAKGQEFHHEILEKNVGKLKSLIS